MSTEMNFLGQGFQKLEHYKQRQTDKQRHTDRRHRKHHHVALAGGSNYLCKLLSMFFINNKLKTIYAVFKFKKKY